MLPREDRTLKADPFAQLKLLELQELDAHLDRLNHRRLNLPEHQQLQDLKASRPSLLNRSRDAAIVVDDLDAEQRKADADVESAKARRTRDQQRIESGAITNPKDLQNLSHELESLARRISSLEDVELEIMERREAADAELNEATAALDDLDRRLAELEKSRDAQVGEVDREYATIAQGRAPMASEIPDELLSLYEKLRAAKGGVGAAMLRARQCEGCMLTLDNAELSAIKSKPSDEVVRCEECQRILIRTDESGL